MRTLKRMFKEQKQWDDLARELKTRRNEIMMKDLTNKKLSDKEREELLNRILENLDKDSKWETKNDKWWFKNGIKYGEIRGMFLGAGLTYAGLAIGTVIKHYLNK